MNECHACKNVLYTWNDHVCTVYHKSTVLTSKRENKNKDCEFFPNILEIDIKKYMKVDKVEQTRREQKVSIQVNDRQAIREV